MSALDDKKTIIMLGGSVLQVPAIESAKKLGFRVVCADYDPNAVGFQYADEGSLTSTVDVDAVLDLACNKSADFVITSTSDAPVCTAAYVSEKLGLLTGISYADSICATQKDAMRQRLADNGVPIPSFVACDDESEFFEAVKRYKFDCVIKPADSAASRGVRILDKKLDKSDLTSLYTETVAYSKKGVVMVEERIYGPEVSVEAITIEGETTILAVTDKLVTEPPYLVELGHTEPSRLDYDVQREICSIAVRTIDAIGIVNGPSHTEIKVTNEGPKVIETAARLGGDFITSKLIPLSTGVNLVEESIKVALGLEADLEKRANAGAAIRFITAKESGIIKSLLIDDALAGEPGVKEIELYKNVGDTINSPHSSNDRIGHILCVGEDAGQAASRASAALEYVHVEVVKQSLGNK